MSTVSVGCKIRQGLIMELIEPGLDDNGKPGLRPAAVDADHVRVILKGCNSQRVAPINPKTEDYVITEVEESFARKWFERNKKLPFVLNGQVFLVEKPATAKGEAKDRAGIQTGFEALNPLGDERLKKEAPKAAADLEHMSADTKKLIGAA